MRKAKDNTNVPKRYYRPTLKTCPRCGAPLHWRWTQWDKYVVTLMGRFHIFSLGYSCSRKRCSQSRVIYHSIEAEQVSPKGSSFGFDVIVQVGR